MVATIGRSIATRDAFRESQPHMGASAVVGAGGLRLRASAIILSFRVAALDLRLRHPKNWSAQWGVNVADQSPAVQRLPRRPPYVSEVNRWSPTDDADNRWCDEDRQPHDDGREKAAIR
jgi:hypothetical protein